MDLAKENGKGGKGSGTLHDWEGLMAEIEMEKRRSNGQGVFDCQMGR
jgi:hypothetical protein